LAEAQAAEDKARKTLDDLNAGPTQAELAEARANVTKAQSQLDKLKAGSTKADLAAAEANVATARNNLDSLKAGPSRDELAEAQANVDKAANKLNELKAGPSRATLAEAQAGVAQAQATLDELKAPPGNAEMASAEAEVVKAQKALDKARLNLGKADLLAPFDGVVASVSALAGSNVNAGAEAFTMYDPTGMQIAVEMGESDIAKIKPGQAVNVTLDALPDTVITGTVASVAAAPTDPSSDVVSYEVVVVFNPGDLGVKVGMSANAGIRVERRENVVQVPNRAINSQGPLKTVQVLYGEGRTPVTVRVETGLTNGQATEIVSCVDTGSQCLRPGDQVAITLPSAPSGQQTGTGDQFIMPIGGGATGGPGPGGGFIVEQRVDGPKGGR
jgi:HlyD family secretion protein